MMQTGFKRFLCAFLAIVIAVGMFPVQVIALDEGQSELTWTQATKSVTLQPGSTTKDSLAYTLSIPSELFNNLDGGDGGKISFAFRLPEGPCLSAE